MPITNNRNKDYHETYDFAIFEVNNRGTVGP